MSRRISLAAAALSALTLAACGSSNSHSSSATTAPTTGAAVTTTPTSTSTASTTPTSTTSSTPTNTATSSTGTGTGTGVTTTDASLSSFKTAFGAQAGTFRAIGNDLGKELLAAGKMTNAQLATSFASLESRVAAAQVALEKLQVPQAYKPQLNALTAAFGAIATDLGAIVQDAKNGAVDKAKADTEQLLKDSAKIKALDVAVSKKLGLPS